MKLMILLVNITFTLPRQDHQYKKKMIYVYMKDFFCTDKSWSLRPDIYKECTANTVKFDLLHLRPK